MSRTCEEICVRGKRVLAIVGEPRSGKTAFVNKMVSYITERIRRGGQSYYGAYIYLNLRNYASWLDFEVSATCRRRRLDDSARCVGLARVLEYASSLNLPCFFALDHCNALVERNCQAFLELVRELSRERFADSKIIVVGDRTPVFTERVLRELGQRYSSRYHQVEMQLRISEKISIWSKANQVGKIHSQEVKNLLEKWASNTHSIDEIQAFEVSRKDLAAPDLFRKRLESTRRQEFQAVELQGGELEFFRILAIFPEVFEEGRSFEELNTTAELHTHKIDYLAAFLGVASPGKVLDMLSSARNAHE